PVPEGYPDLQAAPLLCAGLIGYRALSMTGDAARLGLYGFGASAHIVCQVALHQGRRVFAFVREGDDAAREFALELGAEWAGDSRRRCQCGSKWSRIPSNAPVTRSIGCARARCAAPPC